MNSKKIETLDPVMMTVHPAAKAMPEWDENDPRFVALVDDIAVRGIDQPLMVDDRNRIIDGRHRWRAAKRLQMESVPAIIHNGAEVVSVIVNTLIQRRHFSKGAMAYLTYPYMQEAHEEALQRRVERLKEGNKGTIWNAVPYGPTPADFAAQIGIGRKLFDQAAAVWKAFQSEKAYEFSGSEEPQTLRQYFEPKILDSDKPMGLGSVIAGVGWLKEHKQGDPKKTVRHSDLFWKTLDALTSRAKYWEEFDKAEKAELRQTLTNAVCQMPAELVTAFADAVAQARMRNAGGVR